ncbi:MAG: 5-oxoprolinase subunit PxpB [Leeuwenhoekiella sp.]
MNKNPIISSLGDRGILLKWQFKFSPETLRFLLLAKAKLYQELPAGIEITNTYTELLVRYPYGKSTILQDIKALNELNFEDLQAIEFEQRVVQIPVCYDLSFGLDIQLLAEKKKITSNELIDLHTAPLYTVYFIGFLPGFPYLGGLDERLAFPRKKNPRERVLKGAVGIAENQTGIYPQASPAGWQIIGNCPLDLFNPMESEPCLLKAGDLIKFYEIGKAAHERISKAIEQGNYQLQITSKNG